LDSSISYRSIWKVALPIMVSGVAQNVVNVTDSAFLGQLGEVAFGAAGNAGIIYFVLVITGMGFTTGAQIIIGRRNGESNYASIGKLFDHTIYSVIGLGLITCGLVYLFLPAILDLLISSVNIAEAAGQYLSIRLFGIPIALLNFAFIAFFIGIKKTRVLSYATLIMAGVNVFLDYALIFGHFGFPEMGIEGAAIASVCAEVASVLFLIIYTVRQVDRVKYVLFKFNGIDLKMLRRIFKISAPIMLQSFITLGSWLSFFVIIEHIGERELAISHIVRSIYMVLIIPLFAFSSASSTLVSNLIGEGKSNLVLKLVFRIMILSMVCTSIMLLLNIFIPEEMIMIFTNDLTLIPETMPVMWVISGSVFFFASAFIYFHAVTGTGKTGASLLIEAVNVLIYLIGAHIIANVLHESLAMVWASEFIYFTFLGVASYFYLKYGKWKGVKI
jgi:putative MATE family efflux protein